MSVCVGCMAFLAVTQLHHRSANGSRTRQTQRPSFQKSRQRSNSHSAPSFLQRTSVSTYIPPRSGSPTVLQLLSLNQQKNKAKVGLENLPVLSGERNLQRHFLFLEKEEKKLSLLMSSLSPPKVQGHILQPQSAYEAGNTDVRAPDAKTDLARLWWNPGSCTFKEPLRWFESCWSVDPI